MFSAHSPSSTSDAVQPEKRVNWTAVVTYYVLACLISWPFFWWRDIETESWQAWDVPGIVKTASYMWGPGLSALICLFLFRHTHRRTISLFGTSLVRSLLFWFVPIAALSVFVLKGNDAWILPFAGFFIILGEELGWRGFLQDALRPLKPVWRYALIGIMWELWHFTNRMSTGLHISTFIRVGIFIVALAVISFVMGKLTDRTRSLVIAVTLHAWINILFENSGTVTYVIFCVSLLYWAFLIWTWDRPMHNLFNKTTTEPSAQFIDRQ